MSTEQDSTILILQARIKELEEHQREDVAVINHAAASLAHATETIRRYQVVFQAARTLQERFGACVASYDADENPTDATEEAQDALHAASQTLFRALDTFEIPAREEAIA